MKKLLFSIICIISIVGVANAKTQLKYEWGKFEEYEITNANIYKGNLALFKYDDLEWKEYFDVYNDNGEYNVNMEIPDIDYSLYGCGITRKFYTFSNSLISIDNYCGDYYYSIYDDDLNVVETFENLDYVKSEIPIDLVGENDKYYYILSNFFDKETFEASHIADVFYSGSLYDQILEQCSNSEELDENCKKMATELISENLKGTMFAPLMNLLMLDQVIDKHEPINVFASNNNGYALSFYDDDVQQYGINIFDNKNNFTKTIILDSYSEPYVLFKDNYFYVFEVKEKVSKGRTMSVDYYYSVTEYDYKFNKKQEFDLSTLTKEDAINLEANYGRGFWKVLSTEDGFVMITKPNMGPLLSAESDPQLDYDAIQKYSFVYDVVTKETDNGTINVDKTSSKNGEKLLLKLYQKKDIN